jgi:hypothetical protein
MDIVVWLRSLGLGKYEAVFRDNDVDETVLPNLTSEDLKELGVTSVGHRLKPLDAIAALHANAGSKALPTNVETTSAAPSVSPKATQITGLFLRQAFGIFQNPKDPPNLVPKTPEDRDYLKMLYENHTEFARQHQVLRAAATGFFLALIAGLLAATVGQGASRAKDLIVGGIICGLSLLGFLLNAKHHERNALHEDLEMRLLQSLEGGLLTNALTTINSKTRQTHERHYVLAGVEVQTLYSIVYVFTFLIGAVVIIGAFLAGDCR